MSWKLSAFLEPNFDGALMDALHVKGGFRIVANQSQMLSIPFLYRTLNSKESTIVFVTDSKLFYRLKNNPVSDATVLTDWEILQVGGSSSFIPVGTWNPFTNTPVLTDSGASGRNGEFYFVTGSPTQNDFTFAGLFQGETVTLVDGNLVVSVGSYWIAVAQTTTWDSMVKPQSIIDYTNGIVIPHQHLISDIADLASQLASKYDVQSTADHTIDFNTVPDTAIIELEFLKQHYYNASQVDGLLGSFTTNFIGLTDTPSSYTGEALRAIRVKADQTGLEFYTPVTGGGGAEELDQLNDVTISGVILGDILQYNGTVWINGPLTVDHLPNQVFRLETGTSYTIQSTDRGRIIRFANNSPITVNLPTGFPDGFDVVLVKAGDGEITLNTTGTLEGVATITGDAPQFVAVVHRTGGIWMSGATGDSGIDAAANVAWTGTHSFLDSNFSILDNVDNTKIAKFQVSGLTTGTTRTYALPDGNGTLLLGSGTTNELAYWTSSSVTGALSTATYPSLTELSYVKGVTSSLQTQLNDRMTRSGNQFVTGFAIQALDDLTFNSEGGIIQFTADTYFSNTFLRIRAPFPNNSFYYTISSSLLTSNRTVMLPLLTTSSDTFVFENHTQTLINKTLTSPVINTQISGGVTSGGNITATNFIVGASASQNISGAKTFLNNTLLFRNPANTFSYTLAHGAITAARTITLPVLTGNDTFVFEGHTQTLTNKTLTSPRLNTTSTVGHVWTATGTDGSGSWAAPAAGFADPLTTRGDLIYRNASTTTRLPLGSNLQLLGSDGTDALWTSLTVDHLPNQVFRLETGTSYTIQASDRGRIIRFTNSSPITVNLPTGLANGFDVVIVKAGDGDITLSAGTLEGVSTITGASPQFVAVVHRDSNIWMSGASTGAGVTDGDKGDITVSSTGTVWTIDNGVVSLAKMTDVATATVFYRKTTGTGAPEVQTLATLKTDLGLTGTNSGDQTSIVGITGSTTDFNNALTGADFMFVGDAPTAHTHVTTDITDLSSYTGFDARYYTETEVDTLLTGYSLTSHNHTLDSLSNVTITSNTSGEILKWNGTAWINNTLAEAGIIAQGSTTLTGDFSVIANGTDHDVTFQSIGPGSTGIFTVAFPTVNIQGTSLNFQSTTTTYTGKSIFQTSLETQAPINLPHGVAPTSPVNGDIWSTATGFYFRGLGNTFSFSGTNTGDQSLTNTSDSTSHTVTLSASGGSVQFVEGTGITLTTSGTSSNGIITIASTATGGFTDPLTTRGDLIYRNASITTRLPLGSNLQVLSSDGTDALWTSLTVDHLPAQVFRLETGTTYTLQSTDRGRIIRFTNAGTITVTLPNSLVDGFDCVLVKAGDGDINLTATSGNLEGVATISGTAPQFAAVVHRSGNVWMSGASASGGGFTNLTQFVNQTNWRMFYSDGSGDVTELAFGSAGQVLQSNGASAAPTWITPSGGLSDGDKGDITVSGSGATWTIDNSAVTFAKFQNSAAAGLSVIGRSVNSAGVFAEINAGADFNILRRNGSAIGFGSIDLSQSGAVGTSRLGFSNVAQIVGLSVLGRSANTTGDLAAITGTDGQVMRVAGTTLGFGTIATAGIGDSQVTYGKLQNASAGFTILAKATTGAGAYAELAAGTDSILMRSGSGNLAFGTIVTNQIGNSQVTYGKIQNVAANSFLANLTGSPAVLTEVATNRIPLFGSAITGTPSDSTFLRGDGSWQTVAGGSSALNDLTDVTITSPLSNHVLRYTGSTWENGYFRNPVRQETGTSYTLVAADQGQIIEFTNASNVNVTLPNELANDFSCTLVKKGDGNVILTATTTLQSQGNTIFLKDTAVSVYHRASNIWTAVGSLGVPVGRKRTIVLTVGEGSVVTTGGKSRTRVISPYTGTITGWKLVSDTSTTSTLDVWKDTVIPDNADSITGSAKPSLTAAEFNSSTTLTGWTTSVTEGDILMLEVESNNNAQHLSLMLTIDVTA